MNYLRKIYKLVSFQDNMGQQKSFGFLAALFLAGCAAKSPQAVQQSPASEQVTEDDFLLEDLSIAFGSEEKFTECMSQDEQYPGAGYFLEGISQCVDEESLRNFCGGEYYTTTFTDGDWDSIDFYLYCSADEYIEANWKRVQSNHNWLCEYQPLLAPIEEAHQLPRGTLAAIASPHGFESAREKQEGGFFKLNEVTAEKVGIGNVTERFDLTATAKKLAIALKNEYTIHQDLDRAFQSLLEANDLNTFVPSKERVEYIDKVLEREISCPSDIQKSQKTPEELEQEVNNTPRYPDSPAIGQWMRASRKGDLSLSLGLAVDHVQFATLYIEATEELSGTYLSLREFGSEWFAQDNDRLTFEKATTLRRGDTVTFIGSDMGEKPGEIPLHIGAEYTVLLPNIYVISEPEQIIEESGAMDPNAFMLAAMYKSNLGLGFFYTK